MTNALTLADALVRNTIGFDAFQRFAETATNYPPHNIEQVGADLYRLTLAVAGFSRSEIEVIVQHGVLTVQGNKRQQDPAPQYLHRGIAFRDFTRQFKLGEHVEVVNASLDDGLLVIDLERKMPEAQKPRKISIG